VSHTVGYTWPDRLHACLVIFFLVKIKHQAIVENSRFILVNCCVLFKILLNVVLIIDRLP